MVDFELLVELIVSCVWVVSDVDVYVVCLMCRGFHLPVCMYRLQYMVVVDSCIITYHTLCVIMRIMTRYIIVAYGCDDIVSLSLVVVSPTTNKSRDALHKYNTTTHPPCYTISHTWLSPNLIHYTIDIHITACSTLHQHDVVSHTKPFSYGCLLVGRPWTEVRVTVRVRGGTRYSS